MKSLTKSLHVCPEERRRAGPCRGFTLIELVIALSVLLIIFPPTLVIFYQIMQLKFRNEGRMVAVYLAQGVAEHMSQRRFTSVDDIPPTPFTASEISEGQPNPFQNLNFDDYSFQVEVDCVTNDGILNIDNWPTVAGGRTPPDAYKRGRG